MFRISTASVAIVSFPLRRAFGSLALSATCGQRRGDAVCGSLSDIRGRGRRCKAGTRCQVSGVSKNPAPGAGKARGLRFRIQPPIQSGAEFRISERGSR